MPETRRSFITIALQFCLRIYHQESPRKSVGLNLNLTYQPWVYADDIALLGDRINIKKENKDNLLGASRDVGLEINAQKTNYIITSRHPNPGQEQNIGMVKESFENIANLK